LECFWKKEARFSELGVDPKLKPHCKQEKFFQFLTITISVEETGTLELNQHDKDQVFFVLLCLFPTTSSKEGTRN
jgi:hypothetical protein